MIAQYRKSQNVCWHTAKRFFLSFCHQCIFRDIDWLGENSNDGVWLLSIFLKSFAIQDVYNKETHIITFVFNEPISLEKRPTGKFFTH